MRHGEVSFQHEHMIGPRSRVHLSQMLLPDSNHARRNFPPLPLRQFQTTLLRLFLRFERLRQWGELTIDVLEEEPLFDDFHESYIARARLEWFKSPTVRSGSEWLLPCPRSVIVTVV
jgi:hypothetical protein